MTRLPFLALFVGGIVVLAGTPSRAERPVAPPPRAVRPDGTRDPVPAPVPAAKAEDPAVTVDRIIKNSKAVGDKLAMTDTSPDTLKKQDKILADIDALLKPPPPPKSDNKDDKKQDQPKDKKDKNDQPKDKKDKNDQPKDKGMDQGKDNQPKPMPKPKDGMGDPMPMPKPMDGMGDPMPMPKPKDGMGEPMPMGGRRPRLGEPKAGDGQKQPADTEPKPKDAQGEPKKTPAGGTGQPKKAGVKDDGKTVGRPPSPLLPYNDNPAREEWGYYPERMRPQMSRYFKEDFMQRYDKLLKLYYSAPGEPHAP